MKEPWNYYRFQYGLLLTDNPAEKLSWDQFSTLSIDCITLCELFVNLSDHRTVFDYRTTIGLRVAVPSPPKVERKRGLPRLHFTLRREGTATRRVYNHQFKNVNELLDSGAQGPEAVFKKPTRV